MWSVTKTFSFCSYIRTSDVYKIATYIANIFPFESVNMQETVQLNLVGIATYVSESTIDMHAKKTYDVHMRQTKYVCNYKYFTKLLK